MLTIHTIPYYTGARRTHARSNSIEINGTAAVYGRETIKIHARGLPSTTYFVELLYVRLGIKEAALVIEVEIDPHLFFTFISNGSTLVHLIDFRFTCSYAETPYTCIATPLGGNFSIIGGVV
jgi:hypothetical protein